MYKRQLLLHGRLKVTQVTEDGQQIIVRVVQPGDLFGFAKALQRTDYPGTARAATESVILGWPTDLWPHFVEQAYGRVVSTTSNSGLLGIAGSSAYAAAKAGVYGLTRSLSLEGAALGIRLYKPGLIWPLERDGALAFARGHRALLVVEEKRPVLEDQLLQGMTGTTSRHLNIKVLKRVRIAVPFLSRQEEILAQLDWILGRLGGIRKLRDNQRRALDVLLPSALSKWVV